MDGGKNEDDHAASKLGGDQNGVYSRLLSLVLVLPFSLDLLDLLDLSCPPRFLSLWERLSWLVFRGGGGERERDRAF